AAHVFDVHGGISGDVPPDMLGQKSAHSIVSTARGSADDKTHALTAIEIRNRVGGCGLRNDSKCESHPNGRYQNSHHICLTCILVAYTGVSVPANALYKILYWTNNISAQALRKCWERGWHRLGEARPMTLQRPVVVMKLQWLVVLAALFLGLGIPDSRAVGQ